jgi:hypothetical protein
MLRCTVRAIEKFTLDSSGTPTVRHEQSCADAFNAFMRDNAPTYNCRFHSFSLDGQDRDAGADYVLTDADRFAIVEFKYTQDALVSERHKPKRLNLCQHLLNRNDMRVLHDKCHFISWAEAPLLTVMINIYRHEICTQAVFGHSCGLSAQVPTVTTRTQTGSFAQGFFSSNSSRSLSLADFEVYIAWVLTKTSTSTKSTLELIAYNPQSYNLALVRLTSIAEAQTWVQEHFTPPTQGNQSGMRHKI